MNRFEKTLSSPALHTDCPPEVAATISEALRICAAVEELREEEGSSVRIVCDNPEPETRDREVFVELCGSWTNWEENAVFGGNVLDALTKAVEQKRLAETEGKEPRRV